MTRVLLVEDDRWLAELQADVLRADGYEVQVAHNAIEAIDMIDSGVGAIILDVLLTGNTAFALLNEMRSHVDTGKVPVILCTNMAADLKEDELAHYGVVRVIDKTVMQPDDLLVALRSVS